MIKHGRESLVEIDNGPLVSKKPFKNVPSQRREWLERQQQAAYTVNKLADIGNGAYGVPRITSVDTARFRIMEEKVDGVELTPLLFRTLDDATRTKIIDALAQFYADIHSINFIPNPIEYKMRDHLYLEYLEDFFRGNMNQYFAKADAKFVDKMYKKIMDVSYETRLVWAHGDMCMRNVLYDYKTQKINIIDFTDSDTRYLHDDLLWFYPYELGVVNQVRAQYLKYRDARDLPADFSNDERWEQIKRYHQAATVLEQMNETVQDLQYVDKPERKSRMDKVKEQLKALHKYERSS